MKIKLCNVHKLAVANEGEERKPIFIPFGTWPYDDMISQTLDRPHAEGIAADLDKQIAAGEPGIPVYQGHPDVPEYAGKYPDKGAMGWIKKILVNEDGMECQIEWDRDPGKGFGWFSPYWIGDKPVVGPDGKKNVIVDGLTSIGLVNNPNIREFRLANEILTFHGPNTNPLYKLPEHLMALAKKFDVRRAMANVIDANGMGHSDENGQFDGSGSGNGGVGGKGTFNPKGKKDDAASKKLNELYDKWSAEDDKDENSSATKAALKEYTDYRSKLESSGMRVGVRDHKEGIVALRDEPGSGGGSGGGSAPGGASGPKAEVKAAYDKYKEAEAKFKKWWNPDRKLSEGHNSIARNYSDAQSEFSKKFRQAYGKPTPNGWGSMTLDEIDKAVMGTGKASGGSGSGSSGGAMPKNFNVPNANIFKHSLSKIESRSGKADKINAILRNERKNSKEAGTEFRQGAISGREHREQRRDLRAVHVAAIMSGLSYNRATHQYE